MVGVFLLELLGVVERRLLAVLHDAQLLRRPRLPQPDVHLVRPGQDVSETQFVILTNIQCTIQSDPSG